MIFASERMKRYKLWIISIILIAILPFMGEMIWSSFISTSPPEDGSKPPTAVTVAEVRSEVIHDRVEALGTTFANESAEIAANATERIVAIHFEDGQSVKEGELIVDLDQEEETAQRAAAVEQLAEHRRELKRLQRAVRSRAVSQREYDRRQTLVAITQQRVREIEARIKDRQITAPFDGMLGLRKVSIGALVEPGDVITTIDDIRQIKLDFTVPTTFLSVIEEGTLIKAVSKALNSRVFKGRVNSIATRVDPNTRSVVVRALLPNPKYQLKPGMLMTVTLLKNERRTLVVPEEALVPLQRRNYVLVVNTKDSPTAERREVIIGNRCPGEAEIRTGLEENELVIVRGTTRVRPGDRVQIAETWQKQRWLEVKGG
jgi:membrane fusion protein (multidrug efflux system)